MATHATSFAHTLAAAERLITAPLEVAIVGERAEPRTQALIAELTTRLLPAAVTLAGPPSDLSPLLAGRSLVDGAPTAYVCEHYACRLPVTTPAALRDQLNEVLAARYRAAT
jgi:hypothetical protein